MRQTSKDDRFLNGKEVRILGEDGKEIAIAKFSDAFKKAEDAELDLVEIAKDANPPVVQIMDYGKYVYDKNKRDKRNKKVSVTKELKFHVNIDDHDYQIKLNQMKKFLGKDYKVKITLQYRGREIAHKEIGNDLIEKIIADTEEVGRLESPAKMVGKRVSFMIAPKGK